MIVRVSVRVCLMSANVIVWDREFDQLLKDIRDPSNDAEVCFCVYLSERNRYALCDCACVCVCVL